MIPEEEPKTLSAALGEGRHLAEWDLGKWIYTLSHPAKPTLLGTQQAAWGSSSGLGHAYLWSRRKETEPCDPGAATYSSRLHMLSLQLVDALHQCPDQDIFLWSRGHSWA